MLFLGGGLSGVRCDEMSVRCSICMSAQCGDGGAAAAVDCMLGCNGVLLGCNGVLLVRNVSCVHSAI